MIHTGKKLFFKLTTHFVGKSNLRVYLQNKVHSMYFFFQHKYRNLILKKDGNLICLFILKTVIQKYVYLKSDRKH